MTTEKKNADPAVVQALMVMGGVIMGLGGLILLAAMVDTARFPNANEATKEALESHFKMALRFAAVGGALMVVAQVVKTLAPHPPSAPVVVLGGATSPAVPPPIPVAKFYYLMPDGEMRGPVPLAEIRAMRAIPHELRTVTGETLICREGMEEWKRLVEVVGG